MDAGIADAGTLAAIAGPDVWSDVGAPVRFDASASTGTTRVEWSFGDGSPPSPAVVVDHAYSAPGRYRVVLKAFDAQGKSRTALKLVAVTWPVVRAFRSASTMAATASGVAVVVTDADQLVVVRAAADGGFTRASTPTCPSPVSVAWLSGDDVAVACRSGTVSLHLGTTRLDRDLGAASVPVAVTAGPGDLAVALAGTNEVAFFARDAGWAERRVAVDDPRGLAETPAGFAVARFRSIADAGLVTWLPGQTRSSLAIDPQPSSDTEIGGIPNLLGHLAVSPDGRLLIASALQANTLEGTHRSSKPLTFETTIRAITSFVAVDGGAEQFQRRKQWDGRGRAGAVAFSARGDFLFVAMPGNRLVERYDVLDDAAAGTLPDVGQGIDGLALSPDGRRLFVDAQLSREVVVYDVSDMRALPAVPMARIPTVTAEPLAAAVLRGKQLFHDAADPRLSRDGYLACAHCHPDGEDDGLVWDFTDRGEGLRNTRSMLGVKGTGDGPLHWSANFDEVQDFEGDIRLAFSGKGLLADAQWMLGTTAQPLGAAKAGLSADLDALAAYVAQLPDPAPSPLRTPDGGWSADAEAGRALFDARCASCHAGPRFTDSRFVDAGVPLLHDAGTITAASGQRLGGPLSGLDTPSLVGFSRSPPFLHDGSARTVRDALDRHGVTVGLTAAERDQLEAFVRSL